MKLNNQQNLLITGSNGFVGKNLILFLRQETSFNIYESNDLSELKKFQAIKFKFVIHLAAINRPQPKQTYADNIKFAQIVTDEVSKFNHVPDIIFSSSSQAALKNQYGASKRKAEVVFKKFAAKKNIQIYNLRLPNIFGKWSKPNYNSVVSTFCYNILNDLPIKISDKKLKISLLYIDDLCREIVQIILHSPNPSQVKFNPIYNISLGHLAKTLQGFKFNESQGIKVITGKGIDRALYATYLSHSTKKQFTNSTIDHSDSRGSFIELIKNEKAGQFSFFTAKPGIVRGGHYHHTKAEQFFVVEGEALFRFRSLSTNQCFSLKVKAKDNKSIYSIPGWAHDIKNIGSSDLKVFLWSSEIFNSEIPDTYNASLVTKNKKIKK